MVFFGRRSAEEDEEDSLEDGIGLGENMEQFEDDYEETKQKQQQAKRSKKSQENFPRNETILWLVVIPLVIIFLALVVFFPLLYRKEQQRLADKTADTAPPPSVQPPLLPMELSPTAEPTLFIPTRSPATITTITSSPSSTDTSIPPTTTTTTLAPTSVVVEQPLLSYSVAAGGPFRGGEETNNNTITTLGSTSSLQGTLGVVAFVGTNRVMAYRHVQFVWTHIQDLTPDTLWNTTATSQNEDDDNYNDDDNNNDDDEFGASLDVSVATGLLIGAPGTRRRPTTNTNSTNPSPRVGAVYLFEFSLQHYQFQLIGILYGPKLTTSSSTTTSIINTRFGASVALSRRLRRRILVGAPGFGTTRQGAVYVYDYSQAIATVSEADTAADESQQQRRRRNKQRPTRQRRQQQQQQQQTTTTSSTKTTIVVGDDANGSLGTCVDMNQDGTRFLAMAASGYTLVYQYQPDDTQQQQTGNTNSSSSPATWSWQRVARLETAAQASSTAESLHYLGSVVFLQSSPSVVASVSNNNSGAELDSSSSSIFPDDDYFAVGFPNTADDDVEDNRGIIRVYKITTTSSMDHTTTTVPTVTTTVTQIGPDLIGQGGEPGDLFGLKDTISGSVYNNVVQQQQYPTTTTTNNTKNPTLRTVITILAGTANGRVKRWDYTYNNNDNNDDDDESGDTSNSSNNSENHDGWQALFQDVHVGGAVSSLSADGSSSSNFVVASAKLNEVVFYERDRRLGNTSHGNGTTGAVVVDDSSMIQDENDTLSSSSLPPATTLPAITTTTTQPWVTAQEFNARLYLSSGTAMAMTNQFAVVGGPATGMGQVRTFQTNQQQQSDASSDWSLAAESDGGLTLNGTQLNSLFGSSVVLYSDNNNNNNNHNDTNTEGPLYLAVGAPSQWSDLTQVPTGMVRVYQLNNSKSGGGGTPGWQSLGSSSNGIRGDSDFYSVNEQFGLALALAHVNRSGSSSDDNDDNNDNESSLVVAIGAPSSSYGNRFARGRVYTFHYLPATNQWLPMTTTTTTQQQQSASSLLLIGENVDDRFGYSVDLASSSLLSPGLMVVGAVGWNDFAGAVYIYEWNNINPEDEGWVRLDTLQGGSGATGGGGGGDFFGASVKFLSKDGTYLAVSSPGFNIGAGVVQIFERRQPGGGGGQSDSSSYYLVHELFGESSDSLGSSLDGYSNGNVVVVVASTAAGVVKRYELISSSHSSDSSESSPSILEEIQSEVVVDIGYPIVPTVHTSPDGKNIAVGADGEIVFLKREDE